MSVDLQRKGPIAEGKGPKIVNLMCQDIEDDLGQQVFDAVRARLNQVLVNPTGYYESKVTTERSSDGFRVSDGGVVYGPWLEGTSSRNGRSKFKGYGTFRKVTQDINTEAGREADRVIGTDLGKLE